MAAVAISRPSLSRSAAQSTISSPKGASRPGNDVRTTSRLGFDEKPSYITFKGTLNFIKTDRSERERLRTALET